MADRWAVRAAREDDLPRIAELEDLVFEGTGFTVSTLMELFGPSGATWLVAEDSDGIWGYSLSVRATDDLEVGWLLALGVHPEHRGRHIGLLLLDASIVELQSKGITEVNVTVKPRNEPAYGMFIRAGFRDVGQWKEGDLGDGERRKILTLLLPVVG